TPVLGTQMFVRSERGWVSVGACLRRAQSSTDKAASSRPAPPARWPHHERQRSRSGGAVECPRDHSVAWPAEHIWQREKLASPSNPSASTAWRSEEHTSELQSLAYLVCR